MLMTLMKSRKPPANVFSILVALIEYWNTLGESHRCYKKMLTGNENFFKGTTFPDLPNYAGVLIIESQWLSAARHFGLFKTLE